MQLLSQPLGNAIGGKGTGIYQVPPVVMGCQGLTVPHNPPKNPTYNCYSQVRGEHQRLRVSPSVRIPVLQPSSSGGFALGLLEQGIKFGELSQVLDCISWVLGPSGTIPGSIAWLCGLRGPWAL